MSSNATVTAARSAEIALADQINRTADAVSVIATDIVTAALERLAAETAKAKERIASARLQMCGELSGLIAELAAFSTEIEDGLTPEPLPELPAPEPLPAPAAEQPSENGSVTVPAQEATQSTDGETVAVAACSPCEQPQSEETACLSESLPGDTDGMEPQHKPSKRAVKRAGRNGKVIGKKN